MRRPPNDVSRYVAMKLTELRDKGVTQADMAKRGGISTAQISNLLDGSRNAGMKTMRAAATILGTTWPQLEEDAARWAREARPAPPNVEQPVRWTEVEARYPNLVTALRQLNVGARTRASLANVALHSASDLEVGTWQAMALDLDRKLAREAKTGEAIGAPLGDEDDAPPFGKTGSS